MTDLSPHPTACAGGGNAGTTDGHLPDDPARLSDLLAAGTSMPAEIISTVALDGRTRQVRIGEGSGEMFAEGAHYDGHTLTLEVGGVFDGLALLARLRDDDTAPVTAARRLRASEEPVLIDAFGRAAALLTAESMAARPMDMADRRQLQGEAAVLTAFARDAAAAFDRQSGGGA